MRSAFSCNALPALAAVFLMAKALPAFAQTQTPAQPSAQNSTSPSSATTSAEWACDTQAPLPAQFKGFDAPLKQTASLTPDIAPNISLSAAYRLDLSPALGLAYISAPKKPPEDGRYAGFSTFTITKEGLYSVAASHSVWIDVYTGSEAVRSSSLGRVECSIIHKVVNFPLKPGSYMLQLSNSPVAAVTVMIAPSPEA